jgi:iron complex transport system substrate-binding protein
VGACSVVIGALASCGRGDTATATSATDVPRIVSVGGAVTETVFALGAGDRIVAVDTSSVFPVDATARQPRVGYQRQLSAEGVLAQHPTLVLASQDAGPAAALQQLRDAGVRVVLIDDGGFTPDSARAKIAAIAAAIGKEAEGRALATRLADETAGAVALAARATSRPRVLFVYARGAGAAHVAGRATAADAMIRLAGGENAITGFDGFKPLTAEAVAQAAPDVILVPARGLASLGGVDGLLAQPGMAFTPAAPTRRVIAIDDVLLLGFGPRLGQGLRDLALGLHPELTSGASK